jgi:hypothetical protein
MLLPGEDDPAALTFLVRQDRQKRPWKHREISDQLTFSVPVSIGIGWSPEFARLNWPTSLIYTGPPVQARM